MNVIEEAAHSPLGPSSADRWINCPGSVRLTKGLSDTDSEFAMEGTAAHTLSEIARCANVPAQNYLGIEIAVEKVDGTFQKFTVTQEMADAVQEFIDTCELFPGDAYFESRVRYDKWVPGAYGTADDIRIDENVCNVTDLKYGKGVKVDAEDNAQLKLYALGTLHDYGHLYDLKKFLMHIAQPRIGNFQSAEITTEDLVKWADEVVTPAAKLAMSDNAPTKAGSWCKFCKIKKVCPTRAEWVIRNITDDFEDLTITEIINNTSKPVLKPIALLTNEEVGKLNHLVTDILAWCKDIPSHVVSQLQQGLKVLDWKLVAGRSNRTWIGSDKDIEEKLYELEDSEGNKLVVEEALYIKKLNGPANIEKIIGKKHPLVQIAKIDEETGQSNGGLVAKPPGKPVLVPGSDKRPSLAIDVLKEFSNLDEPAENDNE